MSERNLNSSFGDMEIGVFCELHKITTVQARRILKRLQEHRNQQWEPRREEKPQERGHHVREM